MPNQNTPDPPAEDEIPPEVETPPEPAPLTGPPAEDQVRPDAPPPGEIADPPISGYPAKPYPPADPVEAPEPVKGGPVKR